MLLYLIYMQKDYLSPAKQHYWKPEVLPYFLDEMKHCSKLKEASMTHPRIKQYTKALYHSLAGSIFVLSEI